jgi:predicted Zn-ribbon and HTH transcriptional regulator
MVQLIREEQKRKGIISRDWKCNNCGHSFDEPQQSTIMFGGSEKICPKCQSIEIEKINEDGEG